MAVMAVEADLRRLRTDSGELDVKIISETMLESRGGLESDQQVVRKMKCRCPKCLCSSLSHGNTLGKKKKKLFKIILPGKSVLVQAAIKAASARIRISAAPSLSTIYFLLCLLNFNTAFGRRQLFQTRNVLSAQTMRKVALKKKKRLLSRDQNQHGAIMARSRSLLLFVKWQHTLCVPRLPSLPLCLIL